MQNLLLEMSMRFAPKMGDQYHQEFVRIAMDIKRIEALKGNARPENGHFMNLNNETQQ